MRLMDGLLKLTQFFMNLIALWSQNGSFQTPQIYVFKSIIVPILTYDPESWVMTVIILSQVQAAEMGFLRRVDGVTLRDKVGSGEIRRVLNVESFSSELRDHRYVGSTVCSE